MQPTAIVNIARFIASRSYHFVVAMWKRKKPQCARVKYWQIILENLRNAGWNCGSISITDHRGRQFWVLAAEREDAGRFIVNSDQELPAFLQLESAIKTDRHNYECDFTEPDKELGVIADNLSKAGWSWGYVSTI